MKRLSTILLCLMVAGNLFSQFDDTTLYTKYPDIYGLQYPRMMFPKVLRPPSDTIYTKWGLAIKAGTLYVGNGVYWSTVTGGGSAIDTTGKWIWAQGKYTDMTHQFKNTWYDSTKLRRVSVANEDSAHFDWWWKGDNDPSWTYFTGKNMWVSDNDTVNAANDGWPYSINTNATFQRVTRLNPGYPVGYRFNLMANQVYTNGDSPSQMGMLGGDVGAALYGKVMLKNNAGYDGRTVINGGTPFFNATPAVVSILEVDGFAPSHVHATGYWAGYNSILVAIDPDSVDHFIHYNNVLYTPGFNGNIKTETGFYIDYSGAPAIPAKWGVYAPDATNDSYNLMSRLGVGSFGFGTHELPSFHSSAQFQINSNDRGFITSRMTAAQRIAIASPDTAVFVWDIDSARYMGYQPGTGWRGVAWTGEGGSTPDLQSVTAVGNTTTQQIRATSFRINDSGGGEKGSWDLIDLGGGNIGSNISLYSPGGGTNAAILRPYAGMTGNRIATFPDYSGTVALHPTIVGQAGKVMAVNAGETALEWITPSGGGTNNANVGSGYRLLKPGTQEIKTLHVGYGVLIDSTSNTDEITFKVDTANIKTKASDQKTTDSMLAILNIINNPKDQYEYSWDISGETNAGLHNQVSGTGSAIVRDNAQGFGTLGVVKFSLGTTNTGVGYGYYGNSGLIQYFPMSSALRYNFGMLIRFSAVSDGTDTYKFHGGLMDDHFTPPAGLVDGAFFTYTHSESSGQFVCHTMNNTSESTTASGVTMAANTDYWLQVTVFGGEAKFYINYTLVATMTGANVPDDDAARTVSFEFNVRKSAGTTNRDFYIGKFKYGMLNF